MALCCRYVRFWDAFDSSVEQAAAVTEGLICSYSADGAVLAVGLVETSFISVDSEIIPTANNTDMEQCRISESYNSGFVLGPH